MDKSQVFVLPALQRAPFPSRGTPCLISTLCDTTTVFPLALRQEHVTLELIDEAAADVGFKGLNGDGRETASEIPGRPERKSNGRARAWP